MEADLSKSAVEDRMKTSRTSQDWNSIDTVAQIAAKMNEELETI